MDKKEDKELMEQCILLARQGIDLEKVAESFQSIFDICKEVMELAIKNYKFMKSIKGENKDE